MVERLEIGAPPISVELRRSRRARRMTLRVSATDGKARLSLPAHGSLKAARQFLATQEGWLRAQISKAPAREPIRPGLRITLYGEPFLLQTHGKTRVTRAPGTLFLPANRPAGPALAGFIKSRARGVITNLVNTDTQRLGLGWGRLSLRDPRSRWGSCSSEGNLMFSWRLMLAPPEVLRYVVAHETAHLRHMNHSPAFWSQVAELLPGYAAPRRWLRENGALLHRYDFRTP